MINPSVTYAIGQRSIAPHIVNPPKNISLTQSLYGELIEVGVIAVDTVAVGAVVGGTSVGNGTCEGVLAGDMIVEIGGF